MMRAWPLLALLLALSARGEATTKKAATNAPPSFAVACSNAWLRCVTTKPAVGYRTGEDITFTLSFMGVTNAIPPGRYFYKWTRTGDDGVKEEGRAGLSRKPFAYTTRLAKPGFLRFSAEVVTADGKPFEKRRDGRRERLLFEGGAGASLDEMAGRTEARPRELDMRLKEIRRRVAAVPFKKKAVRTAVAAPVLKGFKVASVSVPSCGARPVTGYLVVPEAAEKGERLPGRVIFFDCGFAKAQPLPQAWEARADALTFVVSCDVSPKAMASEGYHSDLVAQVVRAFQFMKTLPEWNGRGLFAQGGGRASMPALIAGACGESVTKVELYNVFVPSEQLYDPLFFARRIPSECLVDISRASLGNEQFHPKGAAQLWNALACEKKILWVQGAQSRTDQKWFKGRDVLWEALSPVAYHDMTPERCMPVGQKNVAFADIDLALRDKIVLEVVFDPEDTKDLDAAALSQIRAYAEGRRLPFTLYATIPEKKVKDKVWAEFSKKFGGSMPYPIYLDAGMKLPAPERLPWYNVADQEGILRYSGPDLQKAVRAKDDAAGRIPEADPVFAYAPVRLFKAELAKPTKPPRTGQRLYKYIEGEMRKSQRTDQARHDEAEHLLHGMRQARDRRLADVSAEMRDRPGRGLNQLAELLSEWPDMATNPRVVAFRNHAAKNPDLEKMSKLEAELLRLRAWKPVRKDEVKKRDAAVAAFRKKLERYVKGKAVLLQSEATLILSEFDNPPPENEAKP